jgi:hypothetical protein
MRTGRPIPSLTLTDAERETLERWARRAKTAHAVAQRARLTLTREEIGTRSRLRHRLSVRGRVVRNASMPGRPRP